jgi:hypothetical protein
MFEIPATDSDDNVEYNRDQEKVGGENELMVEEMSDDS